MKDQYTSLCENIEQHLAHSSEENAEKLIARDSLLETEMNAFEAGLSATQIPHWQEIRGIVDDLRQYAKLAKIRLLEGDEGVKEIVKKVRSGMEQNEDHEQAAIEIEREMHQYTGVTGVLKSLLMWKPSPQEKLQEKADENT